MIARPSRRFSMLTLLIPAALILCPLYIYPLAKIVALSFGSNPVSIQHYVELFSDPFLLRVFLQTLRLSATIALLCVVIGYPVAYAMRVASEKTQRNMVVMIMLPLWTSVLVRCFAWIVILGRKGLINEALQATGIIDHPLKLVYNSTGVYVGMLHVMLPFMVLPLYNNLCRIDLKLISAAESLGSSRISAFFWIVLPLSMPGVLSGALLVFMGSVGLYVIPALLGGLSETTYVMLIEKQINELNNWELASAMSVLLLVVTGLLTLLYERALSLDAATGFFGRIMKGVFQQGPITLLIWRQRMLAKLPRRSAGERSHRMQRPGTRHGFSTTVAWIIIAALALPMLVIFPMSFGGDSYLTFPPRTLSLRWFENFFSRDDWITPLITSFQVGILATIMSMMVGVPASYAIVRGRFPGKGIITALLISPMIVPVVILAISLYALFAKMNLLGSVIGLAFAHTVLALPYVVVTVSAALRSTDPSLEAAASTLGAGPIQTFYRVTLPILKPAIVSATFLAFLTSFDDLVLALFLGGTNAKTLPLRMWEGIRFEIDPTIAAVSVMLICVTLGLKFIGERTAKRGAKAGRLAGVVGR